MESRRPWLILCLLLAALLLPTACILWFMSVAVRNERLAVRQKLVDTYGDQLAGLVGHVDDYWQAKAAALADAAPDAGAGEAFAGLVAADVCDSVIIYDAFRQLRYPAALAASDVGHPEGGYQWREAERLEYERDSPAAAALAYAQISAFASDVATAARAIQAQGRCLVKAGRTDEAVELFTRKLSDPRYAGARDEQGRFIVPGIQSLALELIGDPAHADYQDLMESVVRRLNDYGDSALPSSQRLFLMRRLQEVVPDCPPFPTLAAEELAAAYLETEAPVPVGEGLSPAGLTGVWQLASSGGTVVALFKEDRLIAAMQPFLAARISAGDVTVKPVPPGRQQGDAAPFLSAPAGQWLPGWQLALYLQGPDPFTAAAARQATIYLWTGFLVVLVFALISLLVGRYLLRQIRLTALKNNFIATVSHELKTPLSSMRVLVDTLLEGRYHDQQQVREYLQLVAKENLRLSRLIDNFLTFSRMERNKVAFEFAELRPDEILAEAAESVREKFASGACRFDVEVGSDLPSVDGDRDALVTVLLNLLDNAYKYSMDDRRVVLRAYAEDGSVCLEVADNGVGMSRRAVRKIFDRFYQVDRSLSRSAGGCGLGLSIVKFIVDAHGGSIEVRSQPGNGSTFTVRLPALVTGGRAQGSR